MTFADMLPHLLAGKVVKRSDHTSGIIAYGWALSGGPDGDELQMVRYHRNAGGYSERLTRADLAADDWEVTDWGDWIKCERDSRCSLNNGHACPCAIGRDTIENLKMRYGPFIDPLPDHDTIAAAAPSDGPRAYNFPAYPKDQSHE